MIKKNILVVTWTRAEYGLLKPLILWLKNSDKYNTFILATWMHVLKKYWYTLTNILDDQFHVDCIVPIREDWASLTWFSEEIIWIQEFLSSSKIDLIFLLWDRVEPLAAAICAAHFKIPIAHIHWWDLTWHLPDEYIRAAITKFSHIHFVATHDSYKRVLEMWENIDNIHVVWAIWLDSINKQDLLKKDILAKKLWLDKNKKWILFLLHPTISDVSYNDQIISSLDSLWDLDGEKIVIYPNSDEGSAVFIENIEKYITTNDFHIFKNIERSTFLSLLNTIDLMMGNSSSGIIESWYFWVPVIDIGDRQKWREASNNVFHAEYDAYSISWLAKELLAGEQINVEFNPYYNWGAVTKIFEVIDKIENFDDLFKNKIKYD